MNAEPVHSSLLCGEACAHQPDVFVAEISLPVCSLKAKVEAADGVLPTQKFRFSFLTSFALGCAGCHSRADVLHVVAPHSSEMARHKVLNVKKNPAFLSSHLQITFL